MAEFLRIILPELLPKEWIIDENYFIRKHQGKSDLRKSIPVKIRTFSHWNDKVGIVVLQDQDSNDCKRLKEELLALCRTGGELPVMVRVVCQELESWYLGDMAAIQCAYSRFRAEHFTNKAKFRNPDLCSAKHELKKILPEYQEISSTKKIAPHIRIADNKSESFRQFVTGITRFATTLNVS